MDASTIEVGQQADKFLAVNERVFDPANVDRQPAGANFYEHHWSSAKAGSVHIIHDEYSFTIPHALGIMGSESIDQAEKGIQSFKVFAGITAEEKVPHDTARLLVMEFLKNLLKAGWKPFISYEDPRLIADMAFRYREEDSYYPLPPDYILSLEQWMTIEDAFWHLYAKNVFAEVTIRRDKELMNVDVLGAYVIDFSIHSAELLAKNYVDPADRDRWKELWVDNIKNLKRMRYEKERELEERGFTIFTEYEEPLIHPEDPVEP